MKLKYLPMLFLFLFPLAAEEGVERVDDPSLLEEVYQEFALRSVQNLKNQEGSLVVGQMTNGGIPLQASVIFQASLMKEMLYSLPDMEVYDSQSYRGNPGDVDFWISGEAYSDQSVIFISLKLSDNRSGRLLAIQNFTVPGNARWTSSFIPQMSMNSGGDYPDTLEPNDSPDSASFIDFPNSGISGSIHSSSDKDYFRFTIPEGEGESFITAYTQGDTDTVMSLYGPDNSASFFQEDDDGGEDYNARVGFPALPGETWWIELSAFDEGGSYQLVLAYEDGTLLDDESNNSFEEAYPMDFGVIYDGTFSYYDEGDFFSLLIDEDMLGRLVTVSTDDNIDTELYCYSEESAEWGESLYYNDDSETYGAKITFIPEEVGLYFFMLTAYEEGAYQISAELREEIDDPTEPNDSPDSAMDLQLNERQTHSFFHDMDVDYFKLTIEQSGTYTVETTGSADPYITLFAEDESYITEDDDSGEDTNAYLEIFLEAGTYFIKVESAVYDVSGTYTLFVQ